MNTRFAITASLFFRRNKIWKIPWATSPGTSCEGRNIYRGISSRRFSVSLKFPHQQQTEKTKAPVNEQHGMIADFERALFRRLEQAGFKRSRRFYWSVSLLTTILVFGGGYLYFFPHKLRQQVVEEVSTVASQSLEDEKIVTKAGQLSKDVISGILNDDATKLIASDFVKDVIVSDPIRNAAIGTILQLLNDPKVLELLRIRLSQIILNILQDDATRQIVMSQVNSILQHESIKTSLQNLLTDLTETPEVKALMSDFFRDVLASDTIKDQGKLLGQQVTSDVIMNKEIQEQAGNALWSAVKYSVIPNIFKGKSSDVKSEDGQIENTNKNADTEKKDAKDIIPQTHDKDNQASETEDGTDIFYSETNDRFSRYDDEA